MSRTAWFGACTAWVLGVACVARADDMDLALSRLRIVPLDAACGGQAGNPSRFCPDQELFERLVSELSVAMAPPVIAPARTIGPRGFQIALSTVLTSIEAGQLYWQRGTEGATPAEPTNGETSALNDDVQSLQMWNYLQARKGLPFGFELGLLLGQGLHTSMWTLGGALKWALFEGFRTGLGQLPDVALQAALNRSVGSSQATVQLFTMDLVVSKSLVIEHTVAVAPLLGLQWLVADVESDVVDLTPGGEGEGGAPAIRRRLSTLPSCSWADAWSRRVRAEAGRDEDFANSVMFEPVAKRPLAHVRRRQSALRAAHGDLDLALRSHVTRSRGRRRLPRFEHRRSPGRVQHDGRGRARVTPRSRTRVLVAALLVATLSAVTLLFVFDPFGLRRAARALSDAQPSRPGGARSARPPFDRSRPRARR